MQTAAVNEMYWAAFDGARLRQRREGDTISRGKPMHGSTGSRKTTNFTHHSRAWWRFMIRRLIDGLMVGEKGSLKSLFACVYVCEGAR